MRFGGGRNATILKGDVAAEVAKLKQQQHGDHTHRRRRSHIYEAA